jgi:MarR family 2-MHQ and catechol resistance regulon transcriptional repressor
MLPEKKQFAAELRALLAKTENKFRKIQNQQMFTEKLTGPQFEVMEILYRIGPMPLKHISTELMVTGANITCVVDNLEKEGFVKRVNSREDRRVIFAELTPAGKSKIESILPKYFDNVFSGFNALIESEQKDLLKLLKKING